MYVFLLREKIPESEPEPVTREIKSKKRVL